MVESRPYPSHKLNSEETAQRKEHIHKEHNDLLDQWYRSDLQPVFDVGRLASPMWHAYRRFYKEKAKANKNVPWESKWERPEAFKQTKHEFLHLKGKKYIEEYLNTDPNDTYNTDIIGLDGTLSVSSYSLLKAEMAKAKHKSKHGLTEFQKNMILLPADLTKAADTEEDEEETNQKMCAIWKKYGKKKPWLYNRVLLEGEVDFGKGPHGVAYMLQFNVGDEDSIEWWDSAHEPYPNVVYNIQNWLEAEGYPDEMKIIDHKNDIPEQRDPFNCGQYMIHTMRALIHWKKPNYDNFTPDPAEPDFQTIDKKLLVGRTDVNGNLVHPSLDNVVRNFSKQKVKDHDRLKKWTIKQMKAFK
jgi:hypothetical protein